VQEFPDSGGSFAVAIGVVGAGHGIKGCGVVEINVLPAVTPGSDMIKTTSEFESERACHGRRISGSGVLVQDLTPFVDPVCAA